jgi:hypothetical protein
MAELPPSWRALDPRAVYGVRCSTCGAGPGEWCAKRESSPHVVRVRELDRLLRHADHPRALERAFAGLQRGSGR